MLMPTSTTNLALAHMLWCYMSVYSLTWGVAQGVGSLGGAAGLAVMIAFMVLARRAGMKTDQTQKAAV